MKEPRQRYLLFLQVTVKVKTPACVYPIALQ